MTGNLRILPENVHDTAALSVSSAQMPVEYTQHAGHSYVWRSVDSQDQTITATLTGPIFMDCVAISKHNLGASGMLRVKLYITGQDTPVYDSQDLATAMIIPAGVWRAGIDPFGATYNELLPGGSELSIHWMPQPVLADRYELVISGTQSSGYFEIGRIFSGLSFSPSVNIDWNPDLDWGDKSEHVETEGGSLRTIKKPRRRMFNLKLSWLSDADREVLVSRLVKNGMGADLLISVFPGVGGFKELEYTMVCRLAQSLSHSLSHYQNWQAPLKFLEA